MFKPIKTKRVYEQIVEQIKILMREGDLKPGDKLMSERELADRLGVSRASVREAFSALDLLGVLETRPGEGTFIVSVSEQSILEPLALIMAMDRDADFELLEVRKMMEAQAAELAALRSRKEDIEKISEAINLMKLDLVNMVLGEESDARFHYCVAEATQNKVLIKFMNTISDLLVQNMRNSRQHLYYKKGNAEKLYNQHFNIYLAIKEGDPQRAKEEMYNHIDFVERELVSDFRD